MVLERKDKFKPTKMHYEYAYEAVRNVANGILNYPHKRIPRDMIEGLCKSYLTTLEKQIKDCSF